MSSIRRGVSPRTAKMTRDIASKLELTGDPIGKSYTYVRPGSPDTSDDEVEVMPTEKEKVELAGSVDPSIARLAALERQVAMLTRAGVGVGGTTHSLADVFQTQLEVHPMQLQHGFLVSSQLGGEGAPVVTGVSGSTTLAELVVEHLESKASKKAFSRLRRIAIAITEDWPGFEHLDLTPRAAEVCASFNGFTVGKEGASIFPGCCFMSAAELAATEMRVGDLAALSNGLDLAEMAELGITKANRTKIGSASDVASIFEVCGTVLLRMSVLLPADKETLLVGRSMVAFGRRLRRAGPVPDSSTLESLKVYTRSFFNANYGVLMNVGVGKAMVYAGLSTIHHPAFKRVTYKLMKFDRQELGDWARRIRLRKEVEAAMKEAKGAGGARPKPKTPGKKVTSGARLHLARKLGTKSCRIILPAKVDRVAGVSHLVCGLSNYSNPEEPDMEHGACRADCERLARDPKAHDVVATDKLKKTLGADRWTADERECLAARRGQKASDIRP